MCMLTVRDDEDDKGDNEVASSGTAEKRGLYDRRGNVGSWREVTRMA